MELARAEVEEGVIILVEAKRWGRRAAEEYFDIVRRVSSFFDVSCRASVLNSADLNQPPLSVATYRW